MNQLNADGQKHGEWEEYFSNGQLKRKINYVNGILNGTFELYFQNGQVSYKGICLNGQEVGFWVDGYPNRKILKLFYL